MIYPGMNFLSRLKPIITKAVKILRAERRAKKIPRYRRQPCARNGHMKRGHDGTMYGPFRSRGGGK